MLRDIKTGVVTSLSLYPSDSTLIVISMAVVYPPEHTLPIQHHPITEACYPHLQLNRQIIIQRIQHLSGTNSCILETTIKKTAATFGDSATNLFMMPNTTHYYKTSSQTWILKPYSHAHLPIK